MYNMIFGTILANLLNNGMVTNKIDSRLKMKVQMASKNFIDIIIHTNLKKDSFQRHVESCEGTIKHELPFIDSYAVTIPSKSLNKIASRREIKFVADDAEIHSLLNIATSIVGSRAINDTGLTGKGVGIAIIDTGVYTHPDLTKPTNRIIAFKDFVNNKQNPYDDNGHGTHCAGDAAGNGYSYGGKYKGIAPDANIISVKVLDGAGKGNTSNILAGMQWVLDNKEKYNIRVVSLSLGDKVSLPNNVDPMVRGCEKLTANGLVVVVAAGNDGPERRTITTPGISSSVITVGALDDKRTFDTKDDVVAEFSSRGPTQSGKTKPDILAPGVNIVSLNKGSSDGFSKPYRTASGTSMATPMIAGASALILEKNPSLTPDEVKSLMLKNAKKIGNESIYAQGHGILDLKSTIKSID